MQTIYKYPIETGFGSVADVRVPTGAQLLDVQFQDIGDQGVARLVAWFIVDTDEERVVNRRFFVEVTGGQLDPADFDYSRHVATLQRNGIVLHVFDGGQW